MRSARCIRCGEWRRCVNAGPNGSPVCQECLYREQRAQTKTASGTFASQHHDAAEKFPALVNHN